MGVTLFSYSDKPLVYTSFLLILVGTASIYSATNFDLQLLTKHLIAVCISIFSFILAVLIPTPILQKYSKYAFIIAVLICIANFSPLGLSVNGAIIGIKIGEVVIHTGEFIKLCSILYLANFIVENRETMLSTSFGVYRPLITLSLLCLFLWVQQSDFAGSIILFISIVGTLFLTGAPLLAFVGILIFTVLPVYIFIVIAPYRMASLTAFTDPWSDPFIYGYQLTHSLIAFGRGELFGLGYGSSIQKLSYLPESHGDFILAVFAEEFGAMGAICLMVLLLFVASRILHIGRIATIAGNWFAGSLAYFTAILFASSILFNYGVNVGVLPTRGISLPFVSFDPYNLLLISVLIGFLVRIDIEYKAKHCR